MGRHNVFDAVEVAAGTLWLGTDRGVMELSGGKVSNAIAGGPLLNDAVVALLAAPGRFALGGHLRQRPLHLAERPCGTGDGRARAFQQPDSIVGRGLRRDDLRSVPRVAAWRSSGTTASGGAPL
ncbi:MAG: hypothetical protein QM757_46235 [Paludibaculum sp.]